LFEVVGGWRTQAKSQDDCGAAQLRSVDALVEQRVACESCRLEWRGAESVGGLARLPIRYGAGVVFAGSGEEVR
jgi:hypothetical protein